MFACAVPAYSQTRVTQTRDPNDKKATSKTEPTMPPPLATASGQMCYCVCTPPYPSESRVGCFGQPGVMTCGTQCGTSCRGELRSDDNCPAWPPPPRGDDNCTSAAPKIEPTAFAANTPRAGKYQLQSAGNDHGAVICIEVRSDDQSEGGGFQQQDCRNNGQTAFPLARHDDSFTYTIFTFVYRITTAKKTATFSKLSGLGADQILPPGCPYSIAEARWVLETAPGGDNPFYIKNQASGDCLQVDGGDVHREGRIIVDRCANIDYAKWRFIPVQ